MTDADGAAHLVALDVDGTLIRHGGGLSEPVRAAVADVVAAGHHVVIATGRSVVAAQPIWHECGLSSGYAVCSNGAVTVRLDPKQEAGWEPVELVTFDPEPVISLLRRELPDVLIGVEDLGVGFKVSREFPTGELSGRQQVVDEAELGARPATRVVLRHVGASVADFLANIERIGLHQVSYAVGWTAWVDISPEGVSKGTALELVRRRLHVEPHLTVAVGDQRNDIEMLRWAARGVAMGDAPDQVLHVADEVTGSAEQDGVVPVLRSLPGVRSAAP